MTLATDSDLRSTYSARYYLKGFGRESISHCNTMDFWITVDAEPLNYSETVLIAAIENENACNPVLRASAQATIQRYVEIL